jgi:hypothetical protein
MLQKIDTYTIPEWALPALINGDYTGLSDVEECAIEEFLTGFWDFEGLVFIDGNTKFFSWSNDIDQFGAECFEVSIHGHLVEKGVSHA